MDSLDEKLLRAWDLFFEGESDETERQITEVLPSLIEAGYVRQEPWGKDYEESEGWFLWHFTEVGVQRYKELENSN